MDPARGQLLNIVLALEPQPAPVEYVRRQTLTNADRYIPTELKSFEDRALTARAKALALEKSLFEELIRQLQLAVAEFRVSAAAAAELDVLTTFAERAVTLNLAAPELEILNAYARA